MKNALILVDIQNDYFTDGLWPVENMDKVAKAAGDILAKTRANQDLVIHIRHEALSDAAPFFRPGTFGAEIHQSVAPAIRRTHHSQTPAQQLSRDRSKRTTSRKKHYRSHYNRRNEPNVH